MLYHIKHWSPHPEMGGAGFSIALFPAWKEAVAQSGIDQANIDHLIKNVGPRWLKDHQFDGELSLYKLRIQWGEWGPEHLSVPGNACGLDIDSMGIGKPSGGAILTPHNVDSLWQASLLLTMFVHIADLFVLEIALGKINPFEAASSPR